jgi:malate synthase
MNAATDALATELPTTRPTAGITMTGGRIPRGAEVFTGPALALLVGLHRRFEPQRRALLAARQLRQLRFDGGELPGFLPSTASVRDGDWRVAAIPADLLDRRVEITGPPERKMVINALNAPVRCFMADFEDACSPTWDNLVQGQLNLSDAIARRIEHVDAATGRSYRLNGKVATLIVRPRGWHLHEKHVRIDGEPVSGALFDFALYLANNHEALARNGTGPYFYLPKLESHLEARLWNDVFLHAQEQLGIPRGTIKATVLIETLPAAFEMHEILHELREHCVGLNCGRWDYIFSYIKKLRLQREALLPDRVAVTMDQGFLKAYCDLLVQTCHRRGAFAMGGMAAQIPIRSDAVANAAALAKVYADKLREVRAGHDGTWIAHPGLAPAALEAFNGGMAGPNQLGVLRPDVKAGAADLLRAIDGQPTDAGLRLNIRVGIQYLESWLGGQGCVPLYNLMEDAATAEISRAQLWQWLRHGARTSDGRPVTEARFDQALGEEIERIHEELGPRRIQSGVFPTAARLFSGLVKDEAFEEFLTLPAYELLP